MTCSPPQHKQVQKYANLCLFAFHQMSLIPICTICPFFPFLFPFVLSGFHGLCLKLCTYFSVGHGSPPAPVECESLILGQCWPALVKAWLIATPPPPPSHPIVANMCKSVISPSPCLHQQVLLHILWLQSHEGRGKKDLRKACRNCNTALHFHFSISCSFHFS